MFARVSRLYRSVVFRDSDEVLPWVEGLADDGRALGPARDGPGSHRVKGRARAASLDDATVHLPVPHVGADENYSPIAEIGSQPLSPELVSDADVIREFHTESSEVLRRLSVDMDDLVGAAMHRLDKVIDDALRNLRHIHV